ncbi:FAD-dependent oxidoreductase [Streptomyces sp. ML-6]|uniref:FAD-dependent oxidoreductase n=1 Tax=Streptomyces sp. ML-6 TaxID=2982693 RepID=UPI0032DEE541
MPPTTTTTGPLPADGPPYDVTVVGAGVVGTAIARELARHRLRIALLDASDDIGNATSKANTAILHTGFDAVPGSLEARPVREGQHLLRTYAAGANIPVERVGALLVAWDEEQLAVLPALLAKAVRNEYHAARLLDAEELYAREPRLGPGARERPRSARLVPGSRPPGVYTTGELQQAVHLYRQRIGTRAVVVGDEPVGRAAVDTLRVAGADVVAVVTDRPHSRLAALTRSANHPPVLDDTTITALTGRQRLTGVAVRHRDGRTTTLRCDTVVFTGNWIPDHELARRGAITLDPGTRGPAYDAAHRTTRNGVFAVGNLLHGVESAAFAAAEGRAVAAPLLRHLAPGTPTRHGRGPTALGRAEPRRARRRRPDARPLQPAHHPAAVLAPARRPAGRPDAPPAAAAAAGRTGPPVPPARPLARPGRSGRRNRTDRSELTRSQEFRDAGWPGDRGVRESAASPNRSPPPGRGPAANCRAEYGRSC